MAIIAASILDADQTRLRDEVTRVAEAGVDAFSLDLMDGRFVPRTTFGDETVEQVRSWVDLPIEVHLMVEQPETWARRMTDAGADMVLFHLEATEHPLVFVDLVREAGRVPGMAVRHDTPLDAIPDDLLAAVGLVNLVAVPVGWGGSPSAADTFERIAQLRRRIDDAGLATGIEVDGGIKPETATRYAEAGADMLTVGTGIYRADDVEEAVLTLRGSTQGPGDAAARERLHGFLSRPSSNRTANERT